MARKRNALRGIEDRRLLRELGKAAREIGHARGRARVRALIRYLTALNRVTDDVLRVLPARFRRAIEAEFPAHADLPFRARRLRKVRAASRKPAPAASAMPAEGPALLWRSHSSASMRKVISELAPYVGGAGAVQILNSASGAGKDLLATVTSGMRPFLGKAAASHLAMDILARVRT